MMAQTSENIYIAFRDIGNLWNSFVSLLMVSVNTKRVTELMLIKLIIITNPEVLGSIPGASRFSEKQWVWNGVHSAS
jgi:hypothetical protein